MRTRLWDLRAAGLDATGQAVLRLGLSDDASTRALWDHGFDLELCVTVGPSLSLTLSTRNTGAAAFTITQALHSYFCVDDIAQTTVLGLDGCAYLDKVQNLAPARQSGAVEFLGETDRIYTDTIADCLIDDSASGRSIRVAKLGSTSTVLWNPWREREQAMADMAAGEYRQMLCVETCNAGADQITLAPGERHTLVAMISVA